MVQALLSEDAQSVFSTVVSFVAKADVRDPRAVLRTIASGLAASERFDVAVVI